jgi:hypothetical protein
VVFEILLCCNDLNGIDCYNRHGYLYAEIHNRSFRFKSIYFGLLTNIQNIKQPLQVRWFVSGIKSCHLP